MGIGKLSPDYVRVANYVVTHTRPDERILAGLDRHDKIFVNPMSLYFVTDRMPGTHWHQFDPGLLNRADIQAIIIDELQQNHVRWIIRDASFNDVNEPNGSAQSSGVTILDDYIAKTYHPVAFSGQISIWLENKNDPIPYSSVVTCNATPIP